MMDMQSRRHRPVGSGLADVSYAVIGAGVGGLAIGKHLLQAGAKDVTIFEIGSKVGGLWCYQNDNGIGGAYRTLHINTARNITNYSDYPFEPSIQMFPDHADMFHYLEGFVDNFNLRRHIRFNTRVTKVRPAASYGADPRWELETASGERYEFDRVVVATGHLHRPMEVALFKEQFEGEYLHSHHYREPEPYVGKRICVVGIGNSAVDIASDVCTNARKTTIVARSGVLIQPKIMFGVPFTDITMRLYRWWIPANVRQKILNTLVYIAHGDLTKYGFRPVSKRVHTTSNALFVNHVAYRRIEVKNEIVDVKGGRLFFSDGTNDEYDTLIAATGYEIDMPFMDPKVVTTKNNDLDLYKRMIIPGWDGLYFVGFIQPTTSLALCMEHQSRWICSVETGHVKLPDPEAMRKNIEAKRAWVLKTFKNTPRHHLEEDHQRYFAEIKSPHDQELFGYKLRV
jgi:dimethylaniline monooxygenase (N-oxide forming)